MTNNKRNKELLVSVILPTHNRKKYIRKAIESVLAQSFCDFELIIINDASADETSEIISAVAQSDPRIKIINNESNLGLVKSLNKGIREAKGKYIARIDDDDVWIDGRKLEKQVAFLENNLDYVIVGGGLIKINENGVEIARVTLLEKDEDIRGAILQNNCFAHSAVLFRKESWAKAGGYDETLDFSEDWDLWLRFGKLGKYYNFQEYFLAYLKAGQNKMSDKNFVIRPNTRVNIVIRKKYRNDFPNFWKAYLFGWGCYVYSFLPLRKFYHPLFMKMRHHLFGLPSYKEIFIKK